MAMQRQLRVMDTDRGRTMSDEQGSSVKVAFATSDLKHVDQHFGSAERFSVYRLSAEGVQLESAAEFGELHQDGDENKLLEKFTLLEGCAAVFCCAVGASAVRQLLSLGVQPLKVPAGTAVAALLDGLQQEMIEGPSGWLARALERRQDKGAERFDEMEAEGWEE